MAINLVFIDFIVPVAKIRKLYPGGWEKCLYDHRRALGGSVYFDKHLFHAGAMDPEGAETLVERWTALGFEATEEVDGKKVWKDFCVLESLLMLSSHPCQWLTINLEERAAHLAGTEPGPVAGRRLFHERRKTEQAKAAFRKSCRRMRWTALLQYRLRNVAGTLADLLNQWLMRQQVWEPDKGAF